jgi:hypothetical protein
MEISNATEGFIRAAIMNRVRFRSEATCCGTRAVMRWPALANAGHDTRALQAYLGH